MTTFIMVQFKTFKTFYVVVSKDEVDFMTKNRFLVRIYEDKADAWDKPMDTWMLEQMRTKLSSSAFHSTRPEYNYAHHLFVNREDVGNPGSDYMVLELVLNTDNVLYFDIGEYITISNNICNGHFLTYLADSAQEAEENKTATPEKVRESWTKLFDVNRPRDPTYCGTYREIHATTPCILIANVTKYYSCS
jgi:hypothetical protein